MHFSFFPPLKFTLLLHPAVIACFKINTFMGFCRSVQIRRFRFPKSRENSRRQFQTVEGVWEMGTFSGWMLYCEPLIFLVLKNKWRCRCKNTVCKYRPFCLCCTEKPVCASSCLAPSHKRVMLMSCQLIIANSFNGNIQLSPSAH